MMTWVRAGGLILTAISRLIHAKSSLSKDRQAALELGRERTKKTESVVRGAKEGGAVESLE